ncbi:MAG: hypothetical protein KIT25_04040 [Enhydrobacter sp.]|nr:MAG: hypothetical protein KIT25_04040 [Enhydrobacter sp.]
MTRSACLSVVLATLVGLAAPSAGEAQAPLQPGPIGNSTGIGSGIGPGAGAGSTGPIYPHQTRDPQLPPAVPPGGQPADPPPPYPSIRETSPYLQPRAPYDSSTPRK